MDSKKLAEFRQLQKLPVTKLKEKALEKYHDELTGVHGMSKTQLLEAICPLLGISYEEVVKGAHKPAIDKKELKTKIKALKTQKAQVLTDQNRDSKQLKVLRRRIKIIKRTLRRAG